MRSPSRRAERPVEDPKLWDDPPRAEAMRERTRLEHGVNGYPEIARELDDTLA